MRNLIGRVDSSTALWRAIDEISRALAARSRTPENGDNSAKPAEIL
jgi:hypothetical protein